jgi:hypothetical protein
MSLSRTKREAPDRRQIMQTRKIAVPTAAVRDSGKVRLGLWSPSVTHSPRKASAQQPAIDASVTAAPPAKKGA